ncbi:hypothetical protein BJ508DRAFT_214905, partial [Ascobolus immersus RN42]
LVGLRDVGTLVVTSESSKTRVYDHCTTVGYLRQVRVETEHLRLWERGVRGNGHMLFLERNNWKAFVEVEKWIAGVGKGKKKARE